MTNTKALLLAFLVLLGMIVSPVCALGIEIIPPGFPGTIQEAVGASNLSIDVSPEGNAIRSIWVDIGTGTKVDFTLWYGNGQSVSGWMEYRNSTDCTDWVPFDAFCQYSGVSLDSDTHGYSYRGVQEVGRIDIVTYARNWTSDTEFTTGFRVWDTTYFIGGVADAYFAVPNGTDNIVYKFDINSNKPVKVVWEYSPRETVGKIVNNNPLIVANDWLARAIAISGAVIGFVASLFWILKFFFIDNIILVIALWLSVSMAYSAMSSSNIFVFYKKFFRTQKALLDFVVGLWDVLVRVVGGMVQALLKWL